MSVRSSTKAAGSFSTAGEVHTVEMGVGSGSTLPSLKVPVPVGMISHIKGKRFRLAESELNDAAQSTGQKIAIIHDDMDREKQMVKRLMAGFKMLDATEEEALQVVKDDFERKRGEIQKQVNQKNQDLGRLDELLKRCGMTLEQYSEMLEDIRQLQQEDLSIENVVVEKDRIYQEKITAERELDKVKNNLTEKEAYLQGLVTRTQRLQRETEDLTVKSTTLHNTHQDLGLELQAALERCKDEECMRNALMDQLIKKMEEDPELIKQLQGEVTQVRASDSSASNSSGKEQRTPTLTPSASSVPSEGGNDQSGFSVAKGSAVVSTMLLKESAAVTTMLLTAGEGSAATNAGGDSYKDDLEDEQVPDSAAAVSREAKEPPMDSVTPSSKAEESNTPSTTETYTATTAPSSSAPTRSKQHSKDQTGQEADRDGELQEKDTIRGVIRAERVTNIKELSKFQTYKICGWQGCQWMLVQLGMYTDPLQTHILTQEDGSLITHEFVSARNKNDDKSATFSKGVPVEGMSRSGRLFNVHIQQEFENVPDIPQELQNIKWHLYGIPQTRTHPEVVFSGDRMATVEIDLRPNQNVIREGVRNMKVTISLGNKGENDDRKTYGIPLGLTLTGWLAESKHLRDQEDSPVNRDTLYAFRPGFPSQGEALPGIYLVPNIPVMRDMTADIADAVADDGTGNLLSRWGGNTTHSPKLTLSTKAAEGRGLHEEPLIRIVEVAQNGDIYLLGKYNPEILTMLNHGKPAKKSNAVILENEGEVENRHTPILSIEY
ncbi:hypothetical protein [Parendozoicomonas sp. Alg238-R29]|uniref:hypothetical protein n=1 Tax=Parendozoicomonas sp. Alg238-R29 TaxID=2993446 RepID=UPI00248DE3FF|nr:hypothetical protein [Parendozoicomonas sp. Alg238-R29]